MHRHNQALIDLLEPEVMSLGFELVGVELGQNGGRSVLRVYIDKDEGIVIDDCVLVSNQLTGILDVEDPIKGHYELEVSSPGLDRPLFKPAHFQAVQGETIKVRLFEKINDRKRFTAILKSSTDEAIVLQTEDEEVVIPFNSIERARLVPDY